jgi:hypothetical protein
MTSGIYKRSKLVYGVGVNDADYALSSKINGKTVRCPFYQTWKGMLRRCYSKAFHKRCHTYTSCTVASEWVFFSKFKVWMDNQDWHGKQLDKDILIQNNKIYSSEACIFVTAEINKLLNVHLKNRGVHAIGVSFVGNNTYQSACRVYGKSRHLGYYGTSEEAHEAYKTFKYKHIAEVANQQSEPLRTALLNYVIEG